MKCNYVLVLMFLACGFLLGGCSASQEQAAKSALEERQTLSLDKINSHVKLVEYDSVHFEEGNYASKDEEYSPDFSEYTPGKGLGPNFEDFIGIKPTDADYKESMEKNDGCARFIVYGNY